MQLLSSSYNHSTPTTLSGGFRNLERGVQPLAREAQPKIFGLPRPLLVNTCIEVLSTDW